MQYSGGPAAAQRRYRARMAQDPAWVRKMTDRENARRRRIQREAIDHYGGRCFCCGETNPLFLVLDHINGGGTRHRKELGRMSVAEWARREGWPPVLQVACHNCNKGRDLNGGMCPHQAGG